MNSNSLPHTGSKCGFCGLRGHNITRCNDPRIPDILNVSRTFIRNIIQNSHNPVLLNNYKEYLTGQSINTIKLLANRNHISSSISKKEMIEMLIMNVQYEVFLEGLHEYTPVQPRENQIMFIGTPDSPATYHQLRRPPDAPTPHDRRRITSQVSISPVSISLTSIFDEEFIPLPPFTNETVSAERTQIVFYPLTNETIEKNDECPICYDCVNFKNQMTTNCNHTFCCNCIKEIIARKEPILDDECQTLNCDIINCPLCRTKITEFSTLNNIDFVKNI